MDQSIIESKRLHYLTLYNLVLKLVAYSFEYGIHEHYDMLFLLVFTEIHSSP